MDYLTRILNAKVYDVAKETSLVHAQLLSARVGNKVLIKREDEQPVFSFKLRGAYNKMAHLPPSQLAAGVVAASSGNHAQGVALAAQKLGVDATIVMPRTTPTIKVDAVRARGAKVILHGESYSDAYEYAQDIVKAEKKAFIHPYHDPDVIMLMALALLMPETVRVLEVATELKAAPVWAVKLKAVGMVSICPGRTANANLSSFLK